MSTTEGDLTDEKPSAVRQVRGILLWRLCCAGMVLLAIATFTPLVIPAGGHEPMLAGIPRTLWAGVLVSLAMVLLALIGAWVHPSRDKDGSDRQ